MSLLQLLVDMVEDKNGVRGKFAKNPESVLKAYNVTDPDERRAAKSGKDLELLRVLQKSSRTAMVAPGDKEVAVTFCGVMKGIGHAGGEDDALARSYVGKPVRKPKKKTAKKKQ